MSYPNALSGQQGLKVNLESHEGHFPSNIFYSNLYLVFYSTLTAVVSEPWVSVSVAEVSGTLLSSLGKKKQIN